jgi:hypothetical protein
MFFFVREIQDFKFNKYMHNNSTLYIVLLQHQQDTERTKKLVSKANNMRSKLKSISSQCPKLPKEATWRRGFENAVFQTKDFTIKWLIFLISEDTRLILTVKPAKGSYGNPYLRAPALPFPGHLARSGKKQAISLRSANIQLA